MCLRQDPLRSFFMVVSGFIVYFCFSFNYPSLKEEVQSKGISESWTGIILGMYSVPSFLFWIFFDKMVNRLGRKCVMLSGLYLFLISLFLFGCIEYANAPFFFVLAGIITRFLLGVGSFQHKTVLYSVATKKFPKKVDQIYSYISMGVNFGIGMGGFMGSLTYQTLSKNVFYINSLFAAVYMVISVPMTHYLLRDKNDKISPDKQHKIQRVDTIAVEKTIPLKYIICDCKSLVHLLVNIWYTFQQNFWMTSLRKSLSQDLDLSEGLIAFIYLIPGICAFILTPFTPCIIRKCGRPNTIIIGTILNLIGYVFFGPLQFLPHKAYFIVIGAALQGFGYPLFFIPSLPLIISSLIAKYPQFYIGPVTDKVSSLGYLCMDSGAIFGTVAGDITYNAYGFRRTVLIYTIVHIFIMAVYFMFGKTGRLCGSASSPKIKVKRKVAQQADPSSARKLENQD